MSPWALVLSALLAIPTALFVWWWAGRTIKPIARITALADDMQPGSLDRRIEIGGATREIQVLADSFNRMLDRLESATTVQRRLIEDTSHALRTPQSLLATNVDVLLADPHPSQSDYRSATELTRRTVARLQTSVNQLLNDARLRNYYVAQCGNDLAVVVREVVEAHEDAAWAAHVSHEATVPPRLLCTMDGPGVTRALSNLVDNAIRHSPVGTRVLVEAGVQDATAFVSVTDQGEGIGQADREHIFDRYRSVDAKREHSRGIGLSIV